MGSWNKLWFFDMNTVVGQELILYNDLVMVVAVAVLVVVGWFMVLFLNSRTFFGGKMNKYVYHNELLEIMWTMVPAFMLCFLGYVSLMNLYIMEVGDHVENGMKVTAHQWFWEYSYIVDFAKSEKSADELWLFDWFDQIDCNSFLFGSKVDLDFNGIEVLNKDVDDSFLDESLLFSSVEMDSSVGEGDVEAFLLNFTGKKSYEMLESISSWIPHVFLNCKWNYSYEVYEVFDSSVLDQGNFRGYTVTDACYLMSSVKNEMLISTTDVMHSWGVGSLGVKCDAVPGRVNSLGISPLRSGVFYGNCYELCGEGHSMMPISVAVMTSDDVSLVLKQGVLGTSDCVSALEEIIK
uniref:Cytochrome c oxidase subunit 2 n=1 Tax=Pliocardia stearnsii TaxID=1298639 RepID=A0A3G9DBF1_9BIVA|nr:cytochrome c oxidase subunit II [Pliocardia stearnsii]